jgi:hypothetical protein
MVFSVDLISKYSDDSIPVLEILDSLGIWHSVNGKNNVGFGRPFFVEVVL